MSTGAVSWPVVAASGALAVAVSPLLASWSAALIGGASTGWWRPRKVAAGQLSAVVAAALILGLLAGHGGPWPAWWLLAVGGTVLATVDAQRNLLPARFVYPLAVLEFAALAATAMRTHNLAALGRAGLAALIVGAVWFALAFAAAGSIGLGDVRVAALTSGLLGWVSWAAVVRAQALTVGLVLVTAAVVALARPQLRGRRMPVPLGPGLILASLLVGWTL